MSALAAAPIASVRPVPWPRLGWVVWRRYRTTLAATVGVLVVLSGYLLINGKRMRSAYDAVIACRPAASAHCQFRFDNFQNNYGDPGLIGVIALLLPGIVGAVAGGPILAREFETGTFRYAWTQGVGRMRWAVAALVPAAVAVAVIMGGFGTLVSWHNQPLADSGLRSRLAPSVFPATGLAAAGWALAGFALGAFAGLVWRRVVAAIVTAFAAWFGLALLAAQVLRPHYLQPLTTTRPGVSGGDLSLDRWWTKGGVRVSDAELNRVLQAIGVHISGGGGKVTVQPGAPPSGDPIQYLLQHGYRQVTSYQPASRYWTLQWIEFGWLVAVSALLLGATFWLLRRRPA